MSLSFFDGGNTFVGVIVSISNHVVGHIPCAGRNILIGGWCTSHDHGKHGKARTNEDKRKVVEHALEHPLTKDKTNYELAKICSVSQPFVAAVRSPESKQKQEDAMKKHLEKKAKEISQTEEKSSIPEQSTGNTNQISSAGPDDEELQSAEMAFQADFDAMYKIIEADEPLKEAFEEVKKLNLLIANLRVRSIGLQNEKDEAVKMVKKLQKELDKIKGKK